MNNDDFYVKENFVRTLDLEIGEVPFKLEWKHQDGSNSCLITRFPDSEDNMHLFLSTPEEMKTLANAMLSLLDRPMLPEADDPFEPEKDGCECCGGDCIDESECECTQCSEWT